jgi:hypothetical protein
MILGIYCGLSYKNGLNFGSIQRRDRFLSKTDELRKGVKTHS